MPSGKNVVMFIESVDSSTSAKSIAVSKYGVDSSSLLNGAPLPETILVPVLGGAVIVVVVFSVPVVSTCVGGGLCCVYLIRPSAGPTPPVPPVPPLPAVPPVPPSPPAPPS